MKKTIKYNEITLNSTIVHQGHSYPDVGVYLVTDENAIKQLIFVVKDSNNLKATFLINNSDFLNLDSLFNEDEQTQTPQIAPQQSTVSESFVLKLMAIRDGKVGEVDLNK